MRLSIGLVSCYGVNLPCRSLRCVSINARRQQRTGNCYQQYKLACAIIFKFILLLKSTTY